MQLLTSLSYQFRNCNCFIKKLNYKTVFGSDQKRQNLTKKFNFFSNVIYYVFGIIQEKLKVIVLQSFRILFVIVTVIGTCL